MPYLVLSFLFALLALLASLRSIQLHRRGARIDIYEHTAVICFVASIATAYLSHA